MRLIAGHGITGLLGRGGMGVVYRAEPPGGGAARALKVLEPRPFLLELWGPEDVRRRFLREARIMKALRHPNLARVLEEGSDDRGRPWYSMELFCDSIEERIGEGFRPEEPTRPQDPAVALDWAAQVLSGLGALHGAGVVHRDVKPANLMLDHQGVVKITDLGLSLLRGEKPSGPANLMIGSPHYAPPEQEAHPDRVGPSADLYSLGVTLHRLVTGLFPDGGADAGSPWELGPAWREFLARALAADPLGRFSAAAGMAAALAAPAREWEAVKERVCRIETGPTPGERSGSPRRTPRRIHPDQARGLLGLDELWRPAARPDHAWWVEGDLVRGSGGGPAWLRPAGPRPLTWDEAGRYILELNARREHGRDDWRLPTLAELLTLVNPPRHVADFCLEPVFPAGAPRLWSADTRSATNAWYVNSEAGFVSHQHRSCTAWVRPAAG